MGYKRIGLLLFIAALLAMLLVALNPDVIAVDIAWSTFNMRLGLALALALAIGMILGVLMRAIWVMELLGERGRLRRALKAAENKARTRAG